jgi:hypothetical protein
VILPLGRSDIEHQRHQHDTGDDRLDRDRGFDRRHRVVEVVVVAVVVVVVMAVRARIAVGERRAGPPRGSAREKKGRLTCNENWALFVT